METSSQLMDPDIIKLAGLHRAEFERAKTDHIRAWTAQAFVAILACVSVFVAEELPAYIATVLALVAVGLKRFFSCRSRRRRARAERARRALFLIHGLGWRLSGKETSDLLASFSGSYSEGRLWEDEVYFDSVEGAGSEALAAIVQENAFWSKHLLALSAKRCWVYSVLSLALLLLVLLLIPGIPSQHWSVLVARVVCIALMFLVAADVLGMAVAYSEAAHIVSSIDEKLINIIASGSPEADVVSVLGDYNAAIQGAPLIPTRIYKRYHDRLNQLWEKRREKPGA